ncbi:MAG: tetratricopeptide repeat protein [Bacteroidales bacterium]|nr:tetratricopeptide repeat protein [Bacteroidales bacterium]
MVKEKKESTAEQKVESIESALTKTERYIEENRKSLSIIFGGILAIVLIYIAFTKLYMGPRESKAINQMYVAEQYFEKDSFKLALNGNGIYPGFLEIIDEYGFTKAANLAKCYAGICYLNLGDFNNAITYLEKFDSDDKLVSNVALGGIGDAYAELGKTDDAIKYYFRAADNVKNDLTSPIYLMRAGILLEEKGDYKKAVDTYSRIEKEFSKSSEARQIEKYITRAEIKGNLKK